MVRPMTNGEIRNQVRASQENFKDLQKRVKFAHKEKIDDYNTLTVFADREGETLYTRLDTAGYDGYSCTVNEKNGGKSIFIYHKYGSNGWHQDRLERMDYIGPSGIPEFQAFDKDGDGALGSNKDVARTSRGRIKTIILGED